jgi:ABC-type multidrug transport system ATPase subunit
VAVSLRDVCRRYGGVTAVQGVSLDVPRGARYVIIGPNGAGKTTLFKMISRQEPVSEGRIELFGTDVRRTAWQSSGSRGPTRSRRSSRS